MYWLFEDESAQKRSCAEIPKLDTGVGGAGENGGLVREATARDVQVGDCEVVIRERAVRGGVMFRACDGRASLVVGGQQACETPHQDPCILGASHETSTIWSPFEHSDRAIVRIERGKKVPCCNLPKEDSTVERTAGDELAIGRASNTRKLGWQDDTLERVVTLP